MDKIYDYISVYQSHGVRQVSTDGTTPDIQKALNYAAHHADLEAVKSFVEAGADVTHDNSMALQGAAMIKSPYFGNLEIISYLVEKGSDVEVIRDTAHPIVSQWLRDNHPPKKNIMKY